MGFLIAWLAAGASFLALDLVWLGIMAPRLHRPQLGDLMRDGFSAPPAIGFYLIYTLGMALLVTQPAATAHAPMRALMNGAILGLVAYATYDLSNWATLKHWSATVTAVDMIWGTAATAVACWAGVLATLAWAR